MVIEILSWKNVPDLEEGVGVACTTSGLATDRTTGFGYSEKVCLRDFQSCKTQFSLSIMITSPCKVDPLHPTFI